MRYTKPPLSFEQQADLLISRGLQVTHRDKLIEKLQVVNYYRLSAYWFPFRQADEILKPGTTLELVWGRYVFDRQLRLLVMDAIERVEVALKTRMAEQHAREHGGFGYLSRNCFVQPTHRWNRVKATMKRIVRPILPFCIAAKRKYLDPHDDFLNRIRQTSAESREEFVRHYFGKYTDEKDLPVWMAVEIMTLGNMLAMFQRLAPEEKRAIAGSFHLMAPVLESWILTLNYVRNLCAHHSRLWNRTLAIRPVIPNKKHGPEWHTPASFGNEKIFAVLTTLRFLLKQVAPQSQWAERLADLFNRYNRVPLREMGFPDNWKECPIWKEHQYGG